MLSKLNKIAYKTHVQDIPEPSHLRATEASRKSLCHEQFEVRGKLWRTAEQIGDPCCLREEEK